MAEPAAAVTPARPAVAAAAAPVRAQQRQGMLLFLGALLAFACYDAFAKQMLYHYPATLMNLSRYIAVCSMAAVLLLRHGDWRVWRQPHQRLLFLRSLMLAIVATIQALQVQKMTLSTLKSMNLNLGDATQAAAQAWSAMGGVSPASAPPSRAKSTFAGLEVPPRTPDPSPAEAPASERPAAKKSARRASSSGPSAAPAGVVDPMQWWGALTQQFQQIAGQAMQDAAQAAAVANAGAAPAATPRKPRKRAATPRATGATGPKRTASRRA